MKNIYIVETQTTTRIGKILRIVTKNEFNHFSVAVDDELKSTCSFARKKYDIPLDGGFITETMNRYTSGKPVSIKTRIYKIPVDDSIHQEIVSKIEIIKKDGGYLYNLFSVSTQPILKGIHIYKSYTCIEFAAIICRLAGVQMSKKRYKYDFKSFSNELKPYLFYEGNLNSIKKDYEDNDDENYFSKSSLYEKVYNTISIFNILAFRSIFYRK